MSCEVLVLVLVLVLLVITLREATSHHQNYWCSYVLWR